jgi:hypothetical protein
VAAAVVSAAGVLRAAGKPHCIYSGASRLL